MSKGEVLTIEHISKSYKRTQALKNVQLEIGEGCYGLLGPNGAGKSTLINILATLIRPDSGMVHMGEIDWNNPKAVRRIISYVPQRFGMYPYVTVQEMLSYFACLKDVPVRETKKQIGRALELTGLTERKDSRIGRLSGGMLRRSAIAQSLLGEPRLLLMDEPTTGLDPEERNRFRNTLHTISQETIVLLSTHIVEDISVCCNRAAVLNNGTVLACGGLEDLRSAVRGQAYIISEEDYEHSVRKPPVLSRSRSRDGGELLLIRESLPKAIPLTKPSLEECYMLLRAESNASKEKQKGGKVIA